MFAGIKKMRTFASAIEHDGAIAQLVSAQDSLASGPRCYPGSRDKLRCSVGWLPRLADFSDGGIAQLVRAHES